MDVEFFLRADDILAFHQYYLERQPRKGGTQWIWLAVGLSLTAVVWFSYSQRGVTDYTLPLFLSIWFLVVTGIALFQRSRIRAKILTQLRRQLDDEWSRKLLGWRRLSLTPESMTYAGKLTTASARWEAVEQITVTDEHAFFFITRTTGFVLPVRAFADEESFREFVKTARRYRKAAHAEAEEQAPSRRPSRAEETGFTAEEPADG